MKIAIAGGGPAGLSCALALAQQNHQITIFEKKSDLAQQGSGVIIQPVGLTALGLLGVREEIEQYGQRLKHVVGRSGPRNRISVNLDYSVLPGDGYALGLHRGALFNVFYQKALACGIKIITGITIQSVRVDPNSIWLNTQHDQCYGPFDLVIDASGAHSPLRNYAKKTGTIKQLQYGSLWGKVNLETEIQFDPERMEMYSDAYNVGIGIMPIGRLSLPDKPQVALFCNLKVADYSCWRDGNLQQWKNQCADYWPATAPFLRQIVHHDQLYLATFLRHTLPYPYGRRLAFVGDAAHATNPQLGQGINMSLLDAVILAWAIKKEPDLSAALALYAQTRKRHVNFYQRMAQLLTPFYQSDNRLAISCRDWLYEPLCQYKLVKSLTATLVGGLMTGPLDKICG